MDVTIKLSIHLVGSEPPRPERFAQLVRDAMHEYLESPRIKEAEEIGKRGGFLFDADIAVSRTIAMQIAGQLPRVVVELDAGEAMIAAATRTREK